MHQQDMLHSPLELISWARDLLEAVVVHLGEVVDVGKDERNASLVMDMMRWVVGEVKHKYIADDAKEVEELYILLLDYTVFQRCDYLARSYIYDVHNIFSTVQLTFA